MATVKVTKRYVIGRSHVGLGLGNAPWSVRHEDLGLVESVFDSARTMFFETREEALAVLEASLSSLGLSSTGVGESFGVYEVPTDRLAWAVPAVEVIRLVEAGYDVLKLSGVEVTAESLALAESRSDQAEAAPTGYEYPDFVEARNDLLAAKDPHGESVEITEVGTSKHSMIDLTTEKLLVSEVGQVWTDQLFGGPFIETATDYFSPGGISNNWVENLSELLPLATAAATVESTTEPVSILEIRTDVLAVALAMAETIAFSEAGGEARNTVDNLSELIDLGSSSASIDNLTEYIPLGS